MNEIDRLKILGNNWKNWWQHGQSLLDSANCILKEAEEKPNMHQVGIMLLGLSVECLFKAIYVKNGGTFVNIDGTIEKKNNPALTHNLYKLAQLENINYSFEKKERDKKLEKSVFQRLQCYVEYGGRYPISKNPDNHKLKQDLNVTTSGLFWAIGRDDKVLRQIIKKLIVLLFEEP